MPTLASKWEMLEHVTLRWLCNSLEFHLDDWKTDSQVKKINDSVSETYVA